MGIREYDDMDSPNSNLRGVEQSFWAVKDILIDERDLKTHFLLRVYFFTKNDWNDGQIVEHKVDLWIDGKDEQMKDQILKLTKYIKRL